MAVRGDALLVPTRAQALAAAGILRSEGASAVLLHGSVAAGTARVGSDVDLVAVFDDIDYGERYPQRWRLEARCADAAGVPVEVHVTDWPEWRHRTTRVGSSFEAAVAGRSETLFERGPQPGTVRWDKEIGMPASDLDEAVDRLSGVYQALGSMVVACRPRYDESHPADARPESARWAKEERLRDLCSTAALTIENALKAWAAANGVPSERTHRVAQLVEQSRPLPGIIEDALAPLKANTMRPSREAYDDVSSWRIGGTYPSALPQATPERTERVARMLAPAAVACTEAVVNRLVSDGADASEEAIARCLRSLRQAQSALASGDVVSGVPAPSP